MIGIQKLLVRAFLALGLAAAAGTLMGAGTNIDLVGDDTDLFTTNPSIPAQVPNVLIVLDNSSNWSRQAQGWPSTVDSTCSAAGITGNQQGDAEVCAIYLSIQSLNSNVNVGLMMFNDNTAGAYVRFPMSAMNSSNITSFNSVLAGINTNNPGDKVSNAKYENVMNDAFRYFNSFATYTQNATAAAASFNGYTDPPASGNCGTGNCNNFKFLSGQNADICGYDYIIFIGNGWPSQTQAISPDLGNAAALYNDSANVAVNTAVIQNTGRNPDVWSRFMFQYGVKVGTGSYRHITTYTIEVCKDQCDKTQTDVDFATVMKSMASVSQGKYKRAKSLSEIQTTLTDIFAEVQAVNSVFAATTLPVSINVRGTNLNQVYIGVFRPDANSSPRWFGNMKQYQLGVNSSTGSLQLVDANSTQAVNLNTGFISNTATSFWTTTYNAWNTTPSAGFWSFRAAAGYATTDVGKDQDSPDGDLVEKGGAAMVLRKQYPYPDSTTGSAITTPTAGQTRNIYTCTGACTSGSTLSGYLFNDANSNITASALGTFQTIGVTSLTASGATATATTSSTHGFSAGDVVTVAGATPNTYNGNFTILASPAPTATTFSYTLSSTPDSTHAYVTLPGYTLIPGSDLVTVTGATPTDYNVSNKAISAVSGQVNQFSYALPASVTSAASGYSVTGVRLVQTTGTATPKVSWSNATVSNNVTVSLTNHGYSSLDTIMVTGATDAAFNTSSPGATITKVDNNTFTYTTLTTPSGTGSTSAVATVAALPSGWGSGITVKVTGATSANYNTSASGSSIVVSGTSFTYTPSASVAAAATIAGTANRIVASDTSAWLVSSASAGTSTLNLVLSRAAYSGQLVHALTTSDTVTIANCSYTAKVMGNTTSFACSGTINAITAGSGTTVSDPGAGNYADLSGGTITLQINAANTSSLTCCTIGATAKGSAPATGATTVTWTGQTVGPDVTLATNVPGPLVIQAAGTIYASKAGDLTSAVTSITTQGVATGTITAGLSTNPDPNERTHLIYWVRGQDNKDDENTKDGALTTGGTTCTSLSAPNTQACDVRSSIHGDVLHSRPAVINYNRNSTSAVTNNDDVFVFYGANDGMFHAVKGGQASDGGTEQWAFVAPEHFSKLKRLRNQTPTISSNNPKDYFFDGPIGAYTLDLNNDGKYKNGDSDKIYLYVGMRRGGRMYYAFDVSDPTSPKLLWKKGCTNATGTGATGGCDSGWDEIGQSWSQPQPVYLRAYPTTLVLIFGAGYDPYVDDFQPCAVTAYNSTSVTALTGVVWPVPMTTANCPPNNGTSSGAISRSMGRGIFIVNATTGEVLKRVGPDAAADLRNTGMTCAMPGDLAILRNRTNSAARGTSGTENVTLGYIDKIYGTDTCGNVWRVDVADADPTKWVVNKFASIATASASSTTQGSPAAVNYRKFEFQPDVVYTSDGNGDFDAVLIGSGDREHPFDQVVSNRFYMFKDRNTATLYALGNVGTNSPSTVYDTNAGNTTPSTGASIVFPAAITESDLSDITNGCLQSSANCSGSQTQTSAAAALLAAKGWMLQLANTGEKTIASATTAAGTVIFNTNQPKQDTVTGTSQNVGSNSGNSCTSDLGTARQYGVSFSNGNAANIYNSLPSQYVPSAGGGRYAVFAGGGFLPQPVPAVVQIGGKYYQTIISGVQATNPGGLSLQRRVRTYWYKKLD